MKNDYLQEKDFAMSVVLKSMHIAMSVWQDQVAVLNKQDQSPVTIADYAIQAFISNQIKKIFETDMVVAEENNAYLQTQTNLLHKIIYHLSPYYQNQLDNEIILNWVGAENNPNKTRYWVLDPIDGTKGFIRGMQYAIALALIEDGEVVLGVLGCPNLRYSDNYEPGLIAYAVKDQGAFVTIPEQKTYPLKVSNQRSLASARVLRSFEDGHTNSNQIDQFTNLAGIKVPPVRLDSQAKYAVLASGQAEVMLRLLSPGKEDYKEKIWDQAPAYRILKEAGGQVTDLNGKKLDFSTGRQLKNNCGIVATNGWLHEQVLDTLKKTI